MEELRNRVETEMKELCRIANQTADMNSMIMGNYKLWNTFTKAYTTFGSAVGAMLIFSEYASAYSNTIGIFSASIFLASFIPYVFDFDKNISERNTAITLLANWIKDAKKFRKVDIFNLSAEQIEEKQSQLTDSYKGVMDKVPKTSHRFLKLKQKHKRKAAISEMIDKYPFMSINKIKQILQEKEQKKIESSSEN